MSILETRKSDYLSRCRASWDGALARCLHYLNTESYGDEYVQLALRILAVDSDVFRGLCGMNLVNSAPCSYGLEAMGYNDCEFLARMRFVPHFIGHQLLDDGDPAVAWGFFDSRDEVKVVSEDYVPPEEDGTYGHVRPYIHTCKEILIEQDPSAKLLTPEDANKVLDWHIESKLKLLNYIKLEIEEDGILYEDDWDNSKYLQSRIEEMHTWARFSQELWDMAHP